MFDQSFCEASITRMLRKSDFIKLPSLRDENTKDRAIAEAVARSRSGFAGVSFLEKSKLRGKSIYSIPDYSDELVLRKINKNIRKCIGIREPNRDSITRNLRSLLSEGVTYRTYRLDIRSFYESFNTPSVIHEVLKIPELSPGTKKLVNEILTHYSSNGGLGIPRGLALSATLSEIMMRSFDEEIKLHPEVFFYSRYVDDIIIITSKNEEESDFLKSIKRLLPKGLFLNTQKTKFFETQSNVKPHKTGELAPVVLSMEFLGYKIIVSEPEKTTEKSQFRDVHLDIADGKVKKLKTKATRAVIRYCQDRDFDLLICRLKFLASNFSVLDADRERKRLAGIYYNYPLVDPYKSDSLKVLDQYIKRIALSGHGKIFDDFYSKTTDAQRRQILKVSFCNGFREKTFLNYSHQKLKKIQECWLYA
ncbi:antiviral reverse transcriptase Drt3a [Pseudomonas citronellolis]|uniref:antiviral reverse transcriptase Drt3a n=1 Tax=Pseudomonas citronellolis TaxID=53408 RepID=UPI0018D92796|nr:antiviral reverse transcriptase Drt3a [Pseudomonas citronellolis]MBH3431421.1 RNA-directed DNA polymerase [Pseudomonas citronellolis]